MARTPLGGAVGSHDPVRGRWAVPSRTPTKKKPLLNWHYCSLILHWCSLCTGFLNRPELLNQAEPLLQIISHHLLDGQKRTIHVFSYDVQLRCWILYCIGPHDAVQSLCFWTLEICSEHFRVTVSYLYYYSSSSSIKYCDIEPSVWHHISTCTRSMGLHRWANNGVYYENSIYSHSTVYWSFDFI